MTPEIVSCKAVDEVELRGRWWPGRPGRGVVVHLHGVQSHGGWFEHSCGRYAQAGYHVFAFDRRGSGLNRQLGTRGLSARLLLEDIHCAIEFAKERTGEEKFFLVGVSWGGKLAVASALKGRLPEGLVLIAPGLFPKVGYSLIGKLRVVLAILFHSKKQFPIPITDPPLFTANPSRQRFIASDPLMLRCCDASLFRADFELKRIVRKAKSGTGPPTFLSLAERDDIIDNAPTRRFVEKWSREPTIRLYPGTSHTLEFEPDPDFWINDVLDWMERFL